jgi:hypothetical protein
VESIAEDYEGESGPGNGCHERQAQRRVFLANLLEVQNKIFEFYFATKKGGSGIGLARTYRYAAAARCTSESDSGRTMILVSRRFPRVWERPREKRPGSLRTNAITPALASKAISTSENCR